MRPPPLAPGHPVARRRGLVTFGAVPRRRRPLAEVSDVPSIFGHCSRAGDPSPFGFGLGGLDGESRRRPALPLPRRRPRGSSTSRRAGSLQLTTSSCSLRIDAPPPADVNFISQLSFAGVAVDARPPSYYLAGVNPELHILCPELAALRDIVFLLKAMMAPTADLLPEPKKWRPVHAVLEWTVLEDETLQVSGFGGVLRCAAYAAEDAKVKRGGAQGVAAALGALVGGGAKSEERRVPPSAALAGSHINGSDVKTEDDVLHVPTKALPDFNGKIKPHDSELLLQYLTVPYLRIALIARFLADRTRVKALVSPQLQALVDGVFFEAGPWRKRARSRSPTRSPSPSGRCSRRRRGCCCTSSAAARNPSSRP